MRNCFRFIHWGACKSNLILELRELYDVEDIRMKAFFLYALESLLE